ncbi:Uncharacterised protein [Vibrio cholerae]|nr:Uncharacterised protein [Vibrio cholerae]CSI45193.1 Uncharacterised protein [Vibrio cholerae]
MDSDLDTSVLKYQSLMAMRWINKGLPSGSPLIY